MTVTQEEIQRLLEYRCGKLMWRLKPCKNIKIGDIAGCLDKCSGYRYIRIHGKLYLEHRLIWLYHYGYILEGMHIDHINMIKNDNRIENLRLVTPQENNFNSSAKGYTWDKNRDKWESRIQINGKKKFLGYFDNEEDARQAYLTAKEQYHIIEDRKVD